MKKYFIALLVLVSIAYVVRTKTMTEAEEQPFLDEEDTEQLVAQPEQTSFIEKIKQFFTSNGNEESKIEPAASTETVLEGTRPQLQRQSATRAVVPLTQSEPEDETVEGEELFTTTPEDVEAATQSEESEIAPFEEETLSATELPVEESAEQNNLPEFEEEELNLTSPEVLLEEEVVMAEPVAMPAHPEPEIQKSEEAIEPVPESAVQKEIDQFKEEAIKGIK
jgi:hypothetical protein